MRAMRISLWQRCAQLVAIAAMCLLVNLPANGGKKATPKTKEQKPATMENTQHTSFLEWDRLTGDWGGVRTTMEDKGLKFGGSSESGYSQNWHGGIDTAGDSFKHRLTFNFTLDTEKLFNWKGGTFFFQYQNHSGTFGTDEVGDIQQYDGLDDPEYNRIHMFWYEQKLFNDKLRIKIGKVEPKSEFFAPEYARNHLGFSTERSPTITQGPPADSINVFVYPYEGWFIGYGFYDAAFNEGRDENDMTLNSIWDNPADTFHILETGAKWKQGLFDLPGDFKVGGWYLDGTLARFKGGRKEGTGGGYAVLDQMLYKENFDDTGDKQGIGAYLQLGIADDDVRAIDHHVGVGMQWVGAIPRRDDDVWGLGLSWVSLSDKSATFTNSHETAYEIFYKAQVMKFMIVQPDLQYIVHPGGVSSRESAVVATVRVGIAF